ncbi:hypothetical protein NDN13_01405 [Acinetobacter sp. C32I]|uniref:hypothetical protein n=1 Tax=Acinetobacter sp. C32I TaxID=2950074 RepID=UPI0020366AA7|nr:hypothetical protein [Acinetobacter sp. C32I]USA53877.1 hypothetical protein NDN13_01405 [Acinetobacter sp. C32I]
MARRFLLIELLPLAYHSRVDQKKSLCFSGTGIFDSFGSQESRLQPAMVWIESEFVA